MNKIWPIILLISLVLIIILAVVVYNIFYMAKNNIQSEIIRYRQFSCLTLPGFTFKYPVFRNLENVKTESKDNDNCELRIGSADNDTVIVIRIYRTVLSNMRSVDYQKTFTTTNKAGVLYRLEGRTETSVWPKIEFFTDGTNPNAPSGIIVEVNLPQAGQVESFNENEFFESIISTFTFYNKNNMNSDEMVIIESGRPHTYRSATGGGVVVIDNDKFYRLTGTRHAMEEWFNKVSTAEKTARTMPLVKVVGTVVSQENAIITITPAPNQLTPDSWANLTVDLFVIDVTEIQFIESPGSVNHNETVTYRINGEAVAKADFELYKSKLSIEPNFATEGTLANGYIHIYRAKSLRDGNFYEYTEQYTENGADKKREYGISQTAEVIQY
ncbi:MAG: hypothetical protein AAB415_01255 [Patescibacteria group bacterium]